MTLTSKMAAALSIAVATLFFYLAFRELAKLGFDLAQRPEVRRALQQSMEDQKKLNRLDPRREDEYRRRFEETATLLQRIDVIRLGRERLLHRLSLVFAFVFAAILVTSTLMWNAQHRRRRERERREYLDRLASWQEASRRHAHEIRTPVTAARLELERLVSAAKSGASGEEMAQVANNASNEFDRLVRFTRNFLSVAAIERPVLREERLDQLAQEFCTLFNGAWPNLTLQLDGTPPAMHVQADRDLLRQVLVNLCVNASRAIAGNGVVRLRVSRNGGFAHVDVTDNGPGIPAAIRGRIFEPYVTTNRAGEGAGLGLAISRKIMLDHGGDLELVESSSAGTTFRLTFPRRT